MKYLTITTILLLSVNTLAFSQRSNQIPQNYIITHSRVNGEDNTSYEVDRKGVIIITEFGDSDRFFLLNNSSVYSDYSYGPISNIIFSKSQEELEGIRADTLKFNWHFHNSYNEISGDANITLIREFKPSETAFNMSMVLPNKEVIEYSGILGKNNNISRSRDK